MKSKPQRRWARWLLAAWEGLLFGWFLFIAYIAATYLIQVSEFVWSSNLGDKLPRLTTWMRNVFPEETWSMMTGIAAFSIGFGLICLTSNEAPSNKLFRWAVIAVLTMLVGLSLPIVMSYTILSGGPDELIWDEVLFVFLSVITLVYGIIRVRRFNRHQA